MRGSRMIDDGKNDPPEAKLEDTESALYSQAMWELEFVQADILSGIETLNERSRLRWLKKRFWSIVWCIGNTYYPGGF